MKYYISRTLENIAFEDAVSKVAEQLKEQGFGILTEIDVRETMKKKLDVDFRNYRILGACNPPFALRALQSEDKIGTMLPCNVIIQEINDSDIEVAAIDPQASMVAVENPGLANVAAEIKGRLEKVINNL